MLASLTYPRFIIVIKFTWMVSITSIYLVTTLVLFGYTLYDQLHHSNGYFAAMMTYMSDQTNLFIVYNTVLALAIIFYRACEWVFFDRMLQGEIVKIIDRLKLKIIDIIFFSYIIELRFDFHVYLVMVVLIFLFILHTHIVLRSEYLVHVHTTSTSLKQHYRVLALYIILFFIDYQILKFSGAKMLSSSIQSEALFVYYMFSTTAILAQPFLQFIVDFYEKYTFTHFKNSDEFLATAGLIVNIPRLVIQLLISVWISYKFNQYFFLIISGIDNLSQLKQTIDSFSRIRKLTTAMTFLKKVKGEELEQFHDLTCTVCYDDMKQAVMLPCKHIFHEECIRQWIVKNLNHFCPKCKKEFNFDKLNEEYKPAVPEPQDYNDLRAFIGNQQNNHRPHLNNLPERKQQEQLSIHPERERAFPHSLEQPKLSAFNRQPAFQQMEREPANEQDHSYSLKNHHFSIINGKNEQVPARHYIIDRPDLSEMPLEFYDSMKKRVVPVGSLPYGLPTMAVSNRTHLHMQKRKEYGKELDVVLRLISMNRNEQLLFL